MQVFTIVGWATSTDVSHSITASCNWSHDLHTVSMSISYCRAGEDRLIVWTPVTVRQRLKLNFWGKCELILPCIMCANSAKPVSLCHT